MVQNSGNDTAEFRAVFGSMAYQQVLSRMCTGLPAGLDYSLSVSALESNIFMTKFTGQQNGLTVIDYRQKINIAEKIAYQGDMTIDPDLQQNHAGTYLSCNNLLLRRACGVEKSKFHTDFMGGYAWQRMGALPDIDAEVAGKLEDAKRSIRSELDYLQRRLGLTPAIPDLDRADGLWAVADMGQRGFLDRLNGFFNRAANPGFEIWDTLDHRLTARAALMKSTYLSDPPQISIGQLVLYGKKIPCYFDLQGRDQNAQRQWQRIRNYMAAKAYPALDSI
jgi:hypothetical protein